MYINILKLLWDLHNFLLIPLHNVLPTQAILTNWWRKLTCLLSLLRDVNLHWLSNYSFAMK